MIPGFWKKKIKEKKKGVIYGNVEGPYRNEEPEYLKLVEIYRGDIRLRLIPKQILHLLFLIGESEKEKIRKIGDIDPALATDQLLDCIKSSPDPGRWREFLNALEKTKFISLLKKIRRQDVDDDTEQRNYVSVMMPQLREMINPREIMAHLLYHDLLISDDKEEIECVINNRGAIEASEMLLERVSGKHPNWYPVLTKLFMKHGHTGAGNMLLDGLCKENTPLGRFLPRSESDSELLRTDYKPTTAAKGTKKRHVTHSENDYTDNALRTCTDEGEDERIYADIDEDDLDVSKKLDANIYSYKRGPQGEGIHKSSSDRYITTKPPVKIRNEVEAKVHFSGGTIFSEEGNQYTSEFKAAEAYQYAYCFYDDTANDDDKSKQTPIYSLRSPTPPSLPPRGTTGTRPDLVSPTFPDDDEEMYEGFDYVQVVKEYDPKYSGQHSLKAGEVYRIQNPLLGGDDDGFYRSIEGKLIPKDNVKIFQKKPIPTPKKRTLLPHEDDGYTQIPKPDKQSPPSVKSQQNDTGKTSERELLMNLLEANRKILESQDEIKSSLAEHQKILNVVCETPVYQEYYNSTQTGGCQLPQTEDVYEMCKDEDDELYAQAEPDVPALDGGGEESDHYVEADPDGILTSKTMSNFKNIRL